MLNILKWIKDHLELLVWLSALPVLYFMPVEGDHISLCVFNALGFTWCPGCGIGHSIHYYLHFDFARGWNEHWLGAFAVLMIIYRIFQLLKQTIQTKKVLYV
ncbi:MAG: DUF2752 domain-containing protein [Owenweeksia sp.]